MTNYSDESMTKNRMNPKVDFYFSKANLPTGKAGKWQKELEKLRMIILDCELTEELKWGVPCYTCPIGSSPSVPARAGGRTFQKSNIVLIHVIKEYCALFVYTDQFDPL